MIKILVFLITIVIIQEIFVLTIFSCDFGYGKEFRYFKTKKDLKMWLIPLSFLYLGVVKIVEYFKKAMKELDELD